MGLFGHKKTDVDSSGKPQDTIDAFKAASGDMEAFEHLVRKYEKYVGTTVYSVVRNYDDAFDVSQEVFLKLYHSIGTFKGESSFSSWLYRIAKNSALDFLRRQKGSQTVSLTSENSDGEEVVLDIPDTSEASNPEKCALKQEQKELLYSAIEELNEEHKQIILLRDIDGYSYEQISSMLCLEPGTVKSRLFRARKSLRKILIEKNYF